MGIRTDLLVTEEIAESSDLRATPFEFERAKRVEAALSILEGKWKIVILNRLFARPIWRFSELERAVPGISQRMLSQQLRLLEKCELVKRTVHPQFPPKVEYELTEFGKTLCPAMKTLVDWAMTFPKTRETSRYQPRKARNAQVDSFRMVFFERDLVVAQLTKTILSQVRNREPLNMLALEDVSLLVSTHLLQHYGNGKGILRAQAAPRDLAKDSHRGDVACTS
jgi:DNA-binding HxlR family transcriptional regulator